MSISTNSIIHYTTSIDVLEKILKEGFKVKYCAEKLLLTNNNKSSHAAHPMVSFSDIPLSNSLEHFEKYGKFGLGLSKEWASKNGFSPVLYIDKNSSLASYIYSLISERRKPNTNLTKKQKQEILRIKAYAKNYAGDLSRDGKLSKNYKFYDEREWRLIPDKSILKGASFSVSLSEYENDKDSYNDKISDLRIKFDPKDISYIIVENTSDIPRIINKIKNIFSGCTNEEQSLIFSKVCSVEQIRTDY